MGTFKDVSSIAMQIQAELHEEQRKNAVLQEQLRQAYMVIQALNEKLRLLEGGR